MTETEASTLLDKAHNKANTFKAPVVVNIRARSVQLLRGYSAARQEAIAERGDGEFIVYPNPPHH